MKFAKQIERDLVPEWREKYFEYKEGKKKVKAVGRAVQRAQGGTPALGKRVELPPRSPPSGFFDLSRTFSSKSRNGSRRGQEQEDVDPLGTTPVTNGKGKKATSLSATAAVQSEPTLQTPIASSPGSGMHYGGFLPPPASSPNIDRNDFSLPGPALKSPLKLEGPALQASSHQQNSPGLGKRLSMQRRNTMMPTISHTPPTATMPALGGNTPRGQLTRLFSVSPMTRRFSNRGDIGLQNLDQVREREVEFFKFMDSQLDKIETFYKTQEEKATKRLELLREQLHEMRNRRTEEVLEAKKRREQHDDESPNENGVDHHLHGWIDPIKSRMFRPGPNSKALQKMTHTPVMDGQSNEHRRDYIRRSRSDVPYRTAKRKLKLALQEFYRGLELLKSYALLNRTAFRKLNKKYDKAVNARPPYRYMNEKVSKSWFVNSDIVDGHLKTVEDLYARYFERGNHKIAAGKLRNLSKGPSDTSGSTFFNGLLIGVGSVFAVQGLVYGAELLFSSDPVIAQRASYLLQIYGGYFLCWYLFTLFCLCARIWTANRVNYHFIFEFDPRDRLDWRELAQFPSVFLLLLGVTLWLNFSQFGKWEAMFLYWPVLLIFVSVVLLFFPAPVLYHRSRLWLLYSLSRLLAAGFYPVEFRDFFLGDMFCSLTYAMCNVELFFCLYAHYWNDPEQCNSSHSWVLGLFGALPPFWRAMQCVRRYSDTRNAFPHLANCGKYTFSILAAVFLSIYRIHGTNTNLALFITLSTINSVYCSLWDILMDVSLVSGNSSHFLLRDILALKYKWAYYVFMVVDPILRFSWIFYAIFTYDAQHSTIVSFMVGFSEVSRRGMWTIFRVENEHCANVRQYKASRDVPLPYNIEPFIERPSLEANLQVTAETPVSTGVSARTTGAEPPSSLRTVPASTPGLVAEEGTPEDGAMGTVRPRQVDDTGRRSIRRVIAEAHKQDFEKKRKPPQELRQKDFEDAEQDLNSDGEDDDDDDDDEDEARSILDSKMDIAEAEDLIRGQPSEGQ